MRNYRSVFVCCDNWDIFFSVLIIQELCSKYAILYCKK